MKEFGSDFHACAYPRGSGILWPHESVRWYASGRMALQAIVNHVGMSDLWVPSYYCHESLGALIRNGIRIRYYRCTPFTDPEEAVAVIPREEGTGVVVMNYFGRFPLKHICRDGLVIIEDHSHDLTGEWASGSNADWCFASVRKTLPVTDGGVLWSPSGYALPKEVRVTDTVCRIALRRLKAMCIKAEYLAGVSCGVKAEFLNDFRETENAIDALELSGISSYAERIMASLDISEWYRRKKENLECLIKNLDLTTESGIISKFGEDRPAPFALVIILSSHDARERLRTELIRNDVYPAVLWNIPEEIDRDSASVGNRMMAIHCDGRYSADDMTELADIINKAFRKCFR